jgi:hypothetical protein
VLDTRFRQGIDQPDLVRSRYGAAFDLKAFSRAFLAQMDTARKVSHGDGSD